MAGRHGSWLGSVLWVLCLGVTLQIVHSQEVELLDVFTPQDIEQQESSEVQSATDYCACDGFSGASVPGRVLYKPKLQDSRRAMMSQSESRIELAMSFDNPTYLGFDRGPRARTPVSQYVDQISGSRHAGDGSKAALFRNPLSQMKLPTPIPITDGVYSLSGWIRWPPGADPSNEYGMRVLTSGFSGDMQVVVNKDGDLGMSIMPFNMSKLNGEEQYGTNFTEDLGPPEATVPRTDVVISPLDSLEFLQELDDAPDCVNCQPPVGSSKCWYQPQGTNTKQLAQTPAEFRRCHIAAKAIRIRKAAIDNYHHPRTTVKCNEACQEQKRRVAQLEHGKGTNELLAKAADVKRLQRQFERSGEQVSHEDKVAALEEEQRLKKSEVSDAHSLLAALASTKKAIAHEADVLKAQDQPISKRLQKKNESTLFDIANTTQELLAAEIASKNVTEQLNNLTQQHEWLAPKRASLDLESWTSLPRPVFTSSGFNMNWLSSGWHLLTLSSNGKESTFFMDSQRVGNIKRVSTSELYSFGNYQAGGYQWGALADLEVQSQAADQEQLTAEMHCMAPLVGTANVTSTNPGTGCNVAGVSIWDQSAAPWCRNQAEEFNYITIQTETPHLITAIATAGAGDYTSEPNSDSNVTDGSTGWVSQFSLSYSTDGEAWEEYEQAGTDRKSVV